MFRLRAQYCTDSIARRDKLIFHTDAVNPTRFFFNNYIMFVSREKNAYYDEFILEMVRLVT